MSKLHSYDMVRNAVIETLIIYSHPAASRSDYNLLRQDVAILLNKWDPLDGYHDDQISENDKSLFYDVFWDLFRQGIINLGYPNEPHTAYPFFQLSVFGKLALKRDEFCFFHDVSSYEKCLKHEIQDIENLTLIYLKEAMQTYLVGCYRSSAVMTGVALEYSLDSLYDIIATSAYQHNFIKISKQITLYTKFNEFKKQLDKIKSKLPPNLEEGLDSNLGTIFDLIRTYRNDSGHPSEKEIKREQCFINLRLFIPCCNKIYGLKKFFAES